MARFFSEQVIDRFRDCFYLNCKSGIISDMDQFKFIMRSVGFSPTNDELSKYLEQKNHSIKFADFLDCAHAQMQVERIPEEILRAFKVSPFVSKHNQNISIDSLRHLMCNWGEKFTHKEFSAMLKEMNITRPEISYKQFVESTMIKQTDTNN